MAGENDAVTLLRYKVDNASVQAAVAANDKVAESARKAAQAAITPTGTLTKAVSSDALDYKRLADNAQAAQIAANNLETASRNAITNGIVTPTYTASAATKNLIRDIGDLSLGIKRMPEPPLSAFGVAESGGRSAGNRLYGAGRALYNLPDVQLGGGVSTTFLSRIGMLGGGAAEALSLTATSLGAVAVIGGVAALAIASVSGRLAESAKNAEAYVTAQTKVDAFIRSGATREDLAGKRDELLAERDDYQRQIDTLTRLRDNVAQASANTQALIAAQGRSPIAPPGLIEANAAERAAREELRNYAGSESFNDINNAIGRLRDEITELNPEIIKAEIALNDGATAAADMAAAEELLKEERERIAQLNAQRDKAFVDAQVQGVQELIAIEQLTYEERQNRIRQIENEQSVIREQLASGELSVAAADQLRAQYQGLAADIERLTDVGVTYADQLEAERINKEALFDQNEQILDLIDQEVAAREKLFEINQRIAEIEAERIADIERITQERDERLLEIGEDNAEARIKIEEDAADRIAKINRDAARATQIAVAERDAVAFKLAELRQKDALEDESKSYDKRLKELERSLDKQLKSLDKSYQKQIETVNTAAQRQLTIQQRLAREQEFIVATSLTSQKFLTESGMAGMVVATANGWTTMQEIVVTALTNIIGAARGIVGGVGGSLFPPLIGGGSGGGGGGGGSSQRYVERIVDRRIGAYFNTAY